MRTNRSSERYGAISLLKEEIGAVAAGNSKSCQRQAMLEKERCGALDSPERGLGAVAQR